jgi:hypothetical protein
MNFAGLIFLIVAHYLSGSGFLRLFKLDLKPLERWCLAMITGVPLLSFAPCFLQLMNIPITGITVGIAVVVCTLVFSIPLFINYKRPELPKMKMPELYEWPFLIVMIGLGAMSLWRCYYFPPYARDMLTGPELLAEYTVREKTMINSVFTLDLGNIQDDAANIFKSPYITGLQIIYKLFVQPFGQVWSSVLFIPFMLWFYSLLKERIHPFFAGLILTIFLISPDLYAYTYVMLYDYSNVLFFFIGFYFLARYLENYKVNYLAWVSLAFGIATYIRVETLFLVMMIVPVLMFYYYKNHMPVKKALIGIGIFLAGSFFFDILCVNIFLPDFIPFKFNVGSMMNQRLGDLGPLFQRLADMSTLLIFSKLGRGSYGYYFVFFTVLLAFDLLWPRRFNREALLALYGIAVVYVGLAILGYVFPNNTLQNTTKRGLFKAMPLMMLYMSNSGFLLYISARLANAQAAAAEKLAAKAAGRSKAAAPVPAQNLPSKTVRKAPVKKR